MRNGTPTSPTTLPTFPTEQEHSNLLSPSEIDGPPLNPLATLLMTKRWILPEDPKHPVNHPSPLHRLPPSPSPPIPTQSMRI
ncbi:hypothetical protein K435DRAFT_866199 [Dendrothele bispora CBS 962.96]|uniref:Uncharacterized protein n=1 Tax=Dendrothele bispora (strain CBS 962.96) TaxID=1314807 RepID=A0A4S8LHJ8_DENBC|nr:hypothetical protein K435DRAFT_866199 [Dendrothele bispora CBS 962.96]